MLFADPTTAIETSKDQLEPIRETHEQGYGVGQYLYSLPSRHSHPKPDRETVAAHARKRESPSAGAKHSSLFANQRRGRDDAVYNNRPHAFIGPPVQIYNPAFAKFILEMSRSHEDMEFTGEELGNALEFIYTSLDFHKDEGVRRSRIGDLRVLGGLLSPVINIDTTKVIIPDGATVVACHGNQRAIARIVEVKNEIGEGGSDPIAQAECGFVLISSSTQVILLLSIVLI